MWETLYGMACAFPIVCFIFVPVYYNLGITSVYQVSLLAYCIFNAHTCYYAVLIYLHFLFVAVLGYAFQIKSSEMLSFRNLCHKICPKFGSHGFHTMCSSENSHWFTILGLYRQYYYYWGRLYNYGMQLFYALMTTLLINTVESQSHF